jgi:amino acid transporter
MLATDETVGAAELGAAAPAANVGHGLRKNALGVIDIILFIIAAASPLGCVITTTPIMIGTGNGVGSPAAFALVTVVLLTFAVGFLTMTPYVKTAGALYAYVTLGLGRYAGLGCAALIIFSYTAMQVGCSGGFGYYASELILATTGLHISWWICCLVAAISCLLFSLHGVHSGAMMLGVLLSTECLLLFILCVGMLFNSPIPLSHFTLHPLSASALFGPRVGVSLVFACAGFIGFEGSTIYREEAKNPDRTIPRATYFAVIFMGAIFSFSTWLIVNVLGEAQAVAIAKRESGNLIFYVSDLVLGRFATHFFNIFIVTALFAAVVTFHNNIARYLYMLGRQRLLWAPLGHTRKIAKTPYIASIVQTMSALLILALFGTFDQDPYAVVLAVMTGIGTVGLILAQAVSAVAIFIFFRRNRVGAHPAAHDRRAACLLLRLSLHSLLYVQQGRSAARRRHALGTPARDERVPGFRRRDFVRLLGQADRPCEIRSHRAIAGRSMTMFMFVRRSAKQGRAIL